MTTQNEICYQLSTQFQGSPYEPYQSIDNIVDLTFTTDFVRKVISIFEAEKSPQTLLITTRDLLQIFYQYNRFRLLIIPFRRWTSRSLKESEDLYYFLIKILKEKAQHYISYPKLLAHLILLLCEIIKTNYSELGFTTRVFDHILTFFHEDENQPQPQHQLQGMDLLNDLLQHMQITEDQENQAIDNGDCIIPDNTSIGLAIFIRLVENMNIEEEVSNINRPFRRNIKNFQKNCLPRIITFTFQQIHKQFNKGKHSHSEKEIKPALFRLLTKCLKASHLVEFIKASEDNYHQLLIPSNQFRPISLITHQIINGLITNYFQDVGALKFLFEIYSAALEVKAFEICNNILQIMTSLLTINSSLSRSAEKKAEYIQTLIEGINSIFFETIRETETEEILLSLTSLISDINLKSSEFFLCKPENEKWFTLLFEATTCLIDKKPIETTLIHSFLQIWASFAQTNEYLIEKSQEFSNYLSTISHSYLFSRAEICGINQQQPHGIDPVEFTRELFITNTKYIGKLIIYNDELCKFMATEFQNLQSNLNLEDTDAMKFIWILYIFSDMIESTEDSQKSVLNKYVEKKWEFVCATIKFFFVQSQANDPSQFYQSSIFTQAKIHFLNQFIMNYCFDRNLTENAQQITQMAQDLNFGSYNDLLASVMDQILMGLPDPSFRQEIIKILERLAVLLNCYYDFDAHQAILRIGKAPISPNVFLPLFKIHLENNFETIPLVSKLRNSLYESLSKFLNLSLEVNSDRSAIEAFMNVFEAKYHQILQLLQGDENSAVIFEEQCVILFNDMTSSLTCIGNEAKYHVFMEQLVKMRFIDKIEKILLVTSSANSEINLAILKFTGELIENTGSRLPKRTSEIRPILLSFALKVTRHIGENTNLNSETALPSQAVFKVIPYMAKVLTNIQTAKLLDLGSIKVTYLDDLQSLCEALFILLNGCPLEIIVAFPETPAKWIYSFLEIVARRKLSYFGQVPHEIWKKILEILHFGIQSVDLNVSINSDETLSHICHQLISSKSQMGNESQRVFEPLFQYMSADSHKIQNILRTCFIIILNGEASNYTYLSRMIKGLSVVENEYYKSLGHELGTFYGQENQYQLMEHFSQLMRVNLSVLERENFRGRLEDFAKKVASFQ